MRYIASLTLIVIAFLISPLLASENGNELIIDGKGPIFTYVNDCGGWTKHRTKVPDQLEAWMLGYISGLATIGPWSSGILQKTTPEAAISWIDNYCRANPLERMGTAAGSLLTTLDARPN